MTLANIEPEKWRRYYFESKDRYYIVILQQDLFHEWSIIKCYGGKDNKLGNMISPNILLETFGHSVNLN